jgi:hypothetical protein
MIGLQHRAKAIQTMVARDFKAQVHGAQDAICHEHARAAGVRKVYEWLAAYALQLPAFA